MTFVPLKNIEVWLGDGKWDVIHFNFGIHDRATPLPDYTQRLGWIAPLPELRSCCLCRKHPLAFA